MVHRIICVTLIMMTFVVTVAAQDRYERQLRQRAIRLEPFIVAAATRYGVDARILRAICFVESRYRLDAVSPKGARGPMQFMPGTAARYGLRDPHDPEQAIEAAARYLQDLVRKFGGRLDLAVAAYNAGEGAVSSFLTGKPLVRSDGQIVNARGVITGGVPPYAETQKYVRSVLTLVRDNNVNGHVETQSVQVRFSPQRGFILDVFDPPDPARKYSSNRSLGFIVVE